MNGVVTNPFKGLRPFGPKDRLFGRDSDLTLMKDRIFRNKTTLLFAGSGVGKTSFFQAKLIPEIERRYRDSFRIVYHKNWGGREPLEALKETLRLPLTEPLTAIVKSAESAQPVIVVLDQFEELFQYQVYWPNFARFRDELCALINLADTTVRFVFSIREEFLGQLSVFDNRIPDLFGNYYRLKNPSLAQAEEIIRLTCECADTSVNDDGLAALVGDLATVERTSSRSREEESFRRDYVFPPHLQLVCKRLWRVARLQAPKAAKLIFLEDYIRQKRTSTANPAQKLLKDICVERMSILKPEQQELAAKALDYLITSQGAKIAYELTSLAKHMKEDRRQLGATLERLGREPRILRESTRQRERWFELYHDMYAPIMYEWKENFERKRSKEREREQRGIFFDRKAIQAEARDNPDAALLFWLSALEIRDADLRRRQVGRIASSTFAVQKTLRHEGQITAMCFGTNSEQILTASSVSLPMLSEDAVTGTREHSLIQVWDRESGLPIGKPIEIQGTTTLLALNAGSSMIAAVSGNKLRIIDLADGTVQSRRIPRKRERATKPWSVHWSANGKFVIVELWDSPGFTWLSVPVKRSAKIKSAGRYQRVVFDTAFRTAVAQKGKYLEIRDTSSTAGQQLPVPGALSAISLSPDGKLLAAGFKNGIARVWETRSFKTTGVPIKCGGMVRRLVFQSYDTLATLCVNKRKSRNGQASLQVQCWNILDGKQINETWSINSNRAVFSPRGAFVYVEPRVGGPAAWRAATGKPIDARWMGRTFAPHITWSNDDRYLLVSNKPSSARLLSSAELPELTPMFTQQPQPISSVKLSPSGSYIACAAADDILIYDAKGKLDRRLEAGAPVTQISFGPSDRLLASMQDNGSLHVWDISSGSRVAGITLLRDRDVDNLIFHPRKKSLLIVGPRVRWWNFGAHETKTRILSRTESNWNARFSDNGRVLIVTHWDGIEVWDGVTTRKLSTFASPEWREEVVVSADGKLILLSKDSGEATIWRTHPGTALQKLAHQGLLDSAAFSPSGRLLVTASQDRFLRIWDVNEGDEVGRFRIDGSLRELRFTPDERGLIAAANWSVHYFGLEPVLAPLASRQLFGRWTGQFEFLKQDGKSIIALLHTGLGSYRAEIIRFDAITTPPTEGSVAGLLRTWQNRIGLWRDNEEAVATSLVRPTRPYPQGKAAPDRSARNH